MFIINSILAFFFLSNEYFDWKKYANMEPSQKEVS